MAKTPKKYEAEGEANEVEPSCLPTAPEGRVFVYVPPSQQSAQYPVAKPGEPMQDATPGLLTPTPALKLVPGKSRKV